MAPEQATQSIESFTARLQIDHGFDFGYNFKEFGNTDVDSTRGRLYFKIVFDLNAQKNNSAYTAPSINRYHPESMETLQLQSCAWGIRIREIDDFDYLSAETGCHELFHVIQRWYKAPSHWDIMHESTAEYAGHCLFGPPAPWCAVPDHHQYVFNGNNAYFHGNWIAMIASRKCGPRFFGDLHLLSMSKHVVDEIVSLAAFKDGVDLIGFLCTQHMKLWDSRDDNLISSDGKIAGLEWFGFAVFATNIKRVESTKPNWTYVVVMDITPIHFEVGTPSSIFQGFLYGHFRPSPAVLSGERHDVSDGRQL